MIGNSSSGNIANDSDPRDGVDPVLLDRLVDGELAETERRKLLLSLDRQPSGWRQCALAFLEAQCWRDLLGVARDEAAPVDPPSPAPENAAAAPAESVELAVPAAANLTLARRKLPRHWLWIGEMAASFLIAFSLGLWIRGGLSTTTVRSGGPMAAAPSAINTGETRTVEVFAEGAGGQVEKMQVPLVDNSRLGWWQSQPAATVPDDVRRAVERAGGQIRQERKYFPVQLPDGRRALMPIDQIDVVPVGNRGMQ